MNLLLDLSAQWESWSICGDEKGEYVSAKWRNLGPAHLLEGEGARWRILKDAGSPSVSLHLLVAQPSVTLDEMRRLIKHANKPNCLSCLVHMAVRLCSACNPACNPASLGSSPCDSCPILAGAGAGDSAGLGWESGHKEWILPPTFPESNFFPSLSHTNFVCWLGLAMVPIYLVKHNSRSFHENIFRWHWHFN
jgi:hypothetical protein